jgi:N-acetylmuramic acid 6-phosphate etherase
MGRAREQDAPEAPAVTEQPNPRTTGLDRMAPEAILAHILEEDESAAAAVRAALPALVRAADLLFRTLDAGGRWFNVGAGTSGRLGMLDAAELPPTFGIDPGSVQAVLAGGPTALEQAVEGAEDDAGAARAELERRGLSARDALLALSASGRTPFALGAVGHARAVGARTIAVTCAPDSPLEHAVDVPIVVVVGPEVIAGSTRMKGGLAQKMVLHALSTTVMVRLGRVRGNLMTELRGASRKLRERAVRIVVRLAHVSPEEAARVLDQAGSVRGALEQLRVPQRSRR